VEAGGEGRYRASGEEARQGPRAQEVALMPHLKLRLDRTIEHLQRYQHIMAVLTKYGFGEVVTSLRRKLPRRLWLCSSLRPVEPANRNCGFPRTEF
ncbi:MAG: hypothetical protein MUO24_02580, partial [Desulfobacterales bacterium]|nr:hypothetical protein [Desulfobacterales bacterium]